MILFKHSCPEINFTNEVPKYLVEINSGTDKRFGRYYMGQLDSLFVKVYDDKVLIKNNSLCKYYLGNNYETLTMDDTKNIIESISDSLHLPFRKAEVFRIDFANNLLMNHEPSLYYSYLGEKPRYKRLEQSDGLYYKIKKTQLCFYDKIKELKQNRHTVPHSLKESKLLRYELRFKKNLKQQFKKEIITTEMLYDKNFYFTLVERWKDNYYSIKKITNQMNKILPTGSTKKLTENLALIALFKLGQPTVLKTIQEWQKKDEISKQQAFRLRTMITELLETPTKGEINEFILELDQKINEVAESAL